MGRLFNSTGLLLSRASIRIRSPKARDDCMLSGHSGVVEQVNIRAGRRPHVHDVLKKLENSLPVSGPWVMRSQASRGAIPPHTDHPATQSR